MNIINAIYQNTCKQCGKILDDQNKKFCNCSCAATYNNLHRTIDQIIIKNENIKKAFKENGITQNYYCKFCGKQLNHNSKGSKYCDKECKHKYNIAITTLIKYYGYDEKKLGSQYAIIEYDKIKLLLYNEYWVNNLTTQLIADKYGYKSCASNIGSKLFKYLGIPLRSLSLATLLNHFLGKLNNNECNCGYKSEWYTTWNGKEVFLRSSYELDYAKELDELKIDYDVECLRIKYWNTLKNDYHCAIPDFYLKDSNTIVEIKSNYTLDIQEMKDKVKAYIEQGYNFKLILEHKEVDISIL